MPPDNVWTDTHLSDLTDLLINMAETVCGWKHAHLSSNLPFLELG